MISLLSQNVRLFGFYLLLIVFSCLPIWSVERFINQDGSPHVYNAYIILELFKDNPSFSSIYSFNSIPIPNLTGYFLLTSLLLFFSAATVTKIVVTLTFSAFVAAIGWLRIATFGKIGLKTSLLFGTVIAFNWMWFLGFYNFIIGVIGFVFSLGLFWQWRENWNLRRTLILAFLAIFVFFSHLIGFLMLGASCLLLSVYVSKLKLKKSLQSLILIFLPVLPFIIIYKLLSETNGSGFSPVWHNLSNPFSISEWMVQLQGADPFLLLSRKTLPFIQISSSIFAVFSPSLWLLLALFCLAIGYLIRKQTSIFQSKYFPFVLLTGFSIVFWIFAPDDFGKSHGGFLRERVLLCGLICFVPLIRTGISKLLKRITQICLIFIIIFQTLVLWEYASFTNKTGQEYLSAAQVVKDTDLLASINLIENGCRYKSNPLTSINPLLGIGKNTRIWDNYEIGYYLFPVIARNPAESQFVFDFGESNAINLCNPTEVNQKLQFLETVLSHNHDKINVMLVWNGDERIRNILSKWYDEKPFFENGRVALHRHR